MPSELPGQTGLVAEEEGNDMAKGEVGDVAAELRKGIGTLMFWLALSKWCEDVSGGLCLIGAKPRFRSDFKLAVRIRYSTGDRLGRD